VPERSRATGARFIARTAVAFALLVAVAIVSVPLFELAPVLSPTASTAADLIDGNAALLPAAALAIHAAALTHVLPQR